ncbi:bifunctional non-homologous end joining protein LigD [Variovorax boronicumulans]|uniref:Bifunctional non-homologous end joining protein LigD n=1 Tax=Variovorax boronicumulans TaxID=436515 RepID=A0AAW8CUI6_9BURK|nr:ankyrin repeat domain-containing protein [Variovorax boronicumulans]MDP9891589.1 bifunctional non-homologous end joining protein LigD [Variovorax boronicumulans]MDQ0051657.1 bifunctional non-homologous end joining protein LigD [Variovorax boronicumulans]
MDPKKIFEAAREADVQTVRACIEAGADMAAVNKQGFTALQCAAMGSNQTEVEPNLAVLRLLLEAGSPLEYTGTDGRTALYLAAEFAPTTDAVQLLLDAGANADVSDSHGNHVTVNAMMEEVVELLARVTGKPIPEPPPPEPDPVKMTTAQWRAAKARIDEVFNALTKAGLVALQDAGQTQSDGFSDCAEVFRERGGEAAGVHGFCFYTRQDLSRAKRSSQLSLAFWGAPKGADADMLRVGELIVERFRKAGFEVRWNGAAAMRPEVDLRELSSQPAEPPTKVKPSAAPAEKSSGEQGAQSSFLYFTGQGSDKVYQVHLRPKDDGWVVDYGNGRRGGTLATGTKTSSPVAFEAALKIYEKVVKEKTSKGYTPDQSGALYTSTDLAGRISGELPQLPTLILEEQVARYFDDAGWGLQEKADGENRILLIEGETVRGTNRRGLFVDIPQSWTGAVDAASAGRTVIAGEHVGDAFKAFDLLEVDGQDLRGSPFIERFGHLQKAAGRLPWMLVLNLETTAEGKRRRAAQLLAAHGEGYVLKALAAPFAAGRSTTSLKFKFNQSATCEVIRVNAQRSVAVGLRDEAGAMVDMGNVTVPPNEALPAAGTLVEVRYLYRYAGGKFEQPVYKGQRPDMTSEDAVLSQVTRIKDRGAAAMDEEAG